jgi:predicted nucleotidyltransferase component of viral defense system
MSQKEVKDLAASVHQRLLNLAKAKAEDFQLWLDRYASERLLYRLSRSEYRDQFVLKGAALLAVWSEEAYRATRDVDLLGWGEGSADHLRGVFREVCRTPVEDDGLILPVDSISVEEIREQQEYGGWRVKLTAMLGRARARVQVDVGYGDVITPGPVDISYPSLLGFPRAMLRGYPRETAVAEKVQALVALDTANSRMKDFSDLYHLSSEFQFDGATLSKALSATFDRRRTPLPTQVPAALTQLFYETTEKQAQWAGFARKSRLSGSDSGLGKVCKALEGFLMPPLRAAADETPFDLVWRPGGPWRNRSDGS